MVNGEYRYFNGGDLVFADASQIGNGANLLI